jgi:Tfp pilus assembly protein PilE
MRISQRKLLKVNAGITLIELIISVALSCIIISIIIPFFLRENYLFNKSIINDRSYLYVHEATLFIESQIEQNSLYTIIDNNKIGIKEFDGTRKEIYFTKVSKDSGNIVVTYYQNAYASTTNILIRNVEDFKVIQKQNLIYLCIITMDGKKFDRCLTLSL